MELGSGRGSSCCALVLTGPSEQVNDRKAAKDAWDVSMPHLTLPCLILISHLAFSHLIILIPHLALPNAGGRSQPAHPPEGHLPTDPGPSLFPMIIDCRMVTHSAVLTPASLSRPAGFFGPVSDQVRLPQGAQQSSAPVRVRSAAVESRWPGIIPILTPCFAWLSPIATYGGSDSGSWLSTRSA
jgi:hypothetical protein